MNPNAPQTTPANWYTDPSNAAQQRYWDGAVWTDHVRPITQPIIDNNAPLYTPAGTPADAGNGLAYAAMVLGVLAVFILPIVFGPIGLILGVMANNKGQTKAKAGMTVAGVGMLVGIMLGILMFTTI